MMNKPSLLLKAFTRIEEITDFFSSYPVLLLLYLCLLSFTTCVVNLTYSSNVKQLEIFK